MMAVQIVVHKFVMNMQQKTVELKLFIKKMEDMEQLAIEELKKQLEIILV